MKYTLNGFDVRFEYDKANLQTSNIITNEVTDDENEYFKFEEEFADSLELFAKNDTDADNVIRGIVSFDPPVDESEHIIETEKVVEEIKELDGVGGKIITTKGSVLLGKMSFKMLTDEFDISKFKLLKHTNAPTTGIKINLAMTVSYQDQTTFRFADATSSKNAELNNIVLSTGEINGENPEESTYKQYNFTPVFNKDIKDYELTLLEYLDTIDVTAIKSDENSTMKISIPKHDEDGNLVYESDGTTIIYEEKDLNNNVPFGVTLNKLGEADTKITILVTAEDGVTKNQYEVLIKRPYGTIRGSIQLGDTLRLSTERTYGIDLDYIADIKVYKNGEIDWNKLLSREITFNDIDKITPQITTKSEKVDGNYELLLIPGVYDIYMETIGFTQAVETQIALTQGNTIDLGNHILYEGDLERDGIIDINDLKVSTNMLRSQIGDGSYDSKYDFHKKGFVDINDVSCVSTNLRNRKTITIK